MSKATEFQKWMAQEYPYDLAECGHCATTHGPEAALHCIYPSHAPMQKAAKRWKRGIQRNITPALRRSILSFREKFARFYPEVAPHG